MFEFAATVTTLEDVTFNTAVRAWDKDDARARLLALGYAAVEIW